MTRVMALAFWRRDSASKSPSTAMAPTHRIATAVHGAGVCKRTLPTDMVMVREDVTRKATAR